MLGRRDWEGEVRPFPDEVEEYSFDDLAKELANRSISRREALWLVSAVGFSAALSAVFPGIAEAKRRKRKKRKKKRRAVAPLPPSPPPPPPPQCSSGKIECGPGCCVTGQFCCQAANNSGLVCCNSQAICNAGGLTCQAILPHG